jgi:hopanoid biosynthesis associated protein HpnK
MARDESGEGRNGKRPRGAEAAGASPPTDFPSRQSVPRRLVVNADDFGRSASINEAVIRAHREGILTTASLMVNEPGCAEAVGMAKANPSLGVGLHLALVCGRSALAPSRIPGLVNGHGEFGVNPVTVGAKYYFNRNLRSQLRAEIHEQFARFRATGLPLDHVNGHLHFHLHPVVFELLMEDATALGIRHLRLTRDGFWRNLGLARGRIFYRASHALVFAALAARAQSRLAERRIRHPRRVFGLLQDSRVDEEFVLNLLSRLPPGDSELYSHPALDKFRHEFDALVSPRVKTSVAKRGIQLIRYQDL